MAMSEEQFTALVERLEAEAGRRPAFYRLKVGLLAALGYTYVLTVLAVTLALIAVLVVAVTRGHWVWALGKLGIFLLVFAAVVLRSLWVRLEPPAGLPLDPGAGSPLARELERLRSALRSPPIHQVLLTSDFNAAVSQVPRLGVFGWQRNYLLLGLPLLQALTPAELRAVLAHELGHLSRAHGRFGGWVYRLRLTWSRLVTELERQGHQAAFVFKGFFAWYAPYFGAYSFVLARAQEYEADRHAAQLAGGRALADGLARCAVAGGYLEESFWPGLLERADGEPRPPADLLGEMARAASTAASDAEAAKRLAAALEAQTDARDTHPCLRDRLAALGEAARIPAPAAETAADHFLGPLLPEVAGSLNRSWSDDLAPFWERKHEESGRQRARLAELEESAEGGAETAELAFERAALTESMRGVEAALPLYRRAVELDPRHPGASFALGRLLIGRGEEEGIAWIEAAMKAGRGFAFGGSLLIAQFWSARGRPERAAFYRERAAELGESLAAADAERSVLRSNDRLLAHALPEATITELAARLARYPEIGAAHLVKKVVPQLPDAPMYVLAVVPRIHLRTQGYYQRLCQRLADELELPGDVLVIRLAAVPKPLRREIVLTPGSEIYRRR